MSSTVALPFLGGVGGWLRRVEWNAWRYIGRKLVR